MKRSKFRDNLLILGILFILTAFSIAINGYFFGIEVHGEVFPIIKTSIDGSLYKNEIMIKFIPYYGTYFYKLLSIPTRIFGLENSFFYIYVLNVYLLHVVIFYIAKLLFKKNIIGYLSVLLYLIDKTFPGSELKPFYVVPRFFVLPFLFLAVYLFLRKRYVLSFFFIGLMMNIHLTSAHQLFLMMLLYFALNYKAVGLKAIIQCLMVFFIVSAPVLYTGFANNTIPLFPPERWFEMVKIKNSHHFDPLFWGFNNWISQMTFVFVFMLSLGLISLKDEKHKKMITLAAGVVLLDIFATISYYFFPISALLTVQWWRSGIFLGIIALIYSSNYLFEMYKKNLSHKIAAVGLGASIILSNFKGVLLFLILIAALSLRKRPLVFKALIAAFLSLSALSVYSSIAPGVPSNIYALKIGFVPFILVSLAIVLTMLFEYSKKRFTQLNKVILGYFMAFLFLIAMLAGSLLIRNLSIWPSGKLHEHMMYSYIYEGKPTVTYSSLSRLMSNPLGFIRHNVYLPGYLEENDWRSLQYWARDNTHKDALFITPPYIDSFRAFSERAALIEWIDIGLVNFDIELANQLWERITDACDSRLFGECRENSCIDLCKKNYNNLDESDFLRLSRKYSASYVIVEKPKVLKLTLAYENNSFLAYKVK
ncbi:hypothetical protein HYS31_02425 [Candidatus Woesearchaeota archaeon]|nr:hypothetical protein [Candidatus Woesearchaeota archaeon]